MSLIKAFMDRKKFSGNEVSKNSRIKDRSENLLIIVKNFQNFKNF